MAFGIQLTPRGPNMSNTRALPVTAEEINLLATRPELQRLITVAHQFSPRYVKAFADELSQILREHPDALDHPHRRLRLVR